ncbi:MAG TPA: peptidase S10 [Acidobacteriaceae bacterium]|nr:peptidase S10 [Acidobacteriaceae bacterium]
MKTSLLNASALSLALTIGLAPGILVPAAHAQDRTPATQDQQRQRRAQTEPGAEPRTGSNTTIAEEGSIPIPPETKSETKHDWTGGGHTIHYTATAGNLLIRDENDKANGSIFYVAYTEDGAPAKSRPVTFLYNGGPGSATIWLHMGSVGPIRVVTKSPEATGPAPFEWVQNEYSLLDKTDLVFIDAPLCGFSRAVGKGTAKDFAGVDQDVKAFEKFITRYITVNQRWGSPKFLFGESYGTPRSAALVAALNNDGIAFNGVTLLSSILNYYVQSPGYDLSATTYLPSYAAIAWHYNKVPHNGDMKDFVQQAREFARGPYATALQQGDQLPPAEFDAIAAKVAAFTGLSVQYVKESKLRISATHFRKELLRGDEQILGRYDARFEGYDVDSAGENPGYDPSDTGISGVFVGAFHDYLASELKYTSSEPYYLQGPGINQNWDWHHRPSGSSFGGGGRGAAEQPDTVLDLADAMRKNPHLHVFSANGWFDLATPFFGTEHDLAQMMLPPSIAKNVEFGYYPAGHMVYLNVEALKEMHADLERFYGEATAH